MAEISSALNLVNQVSRAQVEDDVPDFVAVTFAALQGVLRECSAEQRAAAVTLTELAARHLMVQWGNLYSARESLAPVPAAPD